MARIESVAIGGYYPTPEHLIPLIAQRIGAKPGHRYAFLDPCAGGGEAITALVDALCPRPETELKDYYRANRGPRTYVVELEGKRHELLNHRMDQRWCGPNVVVHGDAFRVTWTESKLYTGISCLYLNPPYDLHPKFGRLEEKFLQRYTPALCEGGILVFVVPSYELSASAETLAKEYSALRCFRFPEADYAVFKQVVLYGRKRAVPLLSPDTLLLAKVQGWAKNPTTIPELVATSKPMGDLPAPPTKKDKYSTEPEAGLGDFKLQPVDFTTLMAAYTPWSISSRSGRLEPLPGVTVDPLSDDLMVRSYPTAMPPRPAHVAAGIASGVFNGKRITADGGKAPDLLVKGVFDREFETVEEKKNAEGEVTGEVQIQQPRLVVTALDLSTSKLHTIFSSVELTGSTDPATMTTGDLLTLYGPSLLSTLKAQCPVLHDPGNPEHHFELPVISRPLFAAQAQATMAAIRVLGGPNVPLRKRQRKAVTVLGQIGSGKTGVSFTAALGCGARKILTLCPPHLLTTWTDEVVMLRPDAIVRVLATVADVQAFDALKVPPGGIAVAVLSREVAKLGHSFAGVTNGCCPKCGAVVQTEPAELARKRLCCEARRMSPVNEEARLLVELAPRLMPYLPTAGVVAAAARLSPVGAKMLPRYVEARQKAKLKEPTEAELAYLRQHPELRALVWHLGAALFDHPSLGWNGPPAHAVSALKHLLAFINDDALTADVAERMYAAAAYFQREHDHYHAPSFRAIARLLVAQMDPGSKFQALQVQRLHAISGQIPAGHGHDGRDVRSLNELIGKLAQHNHATDGHADALSRSMGVLRLATIPMGHADHLKALTDKLYQGARWSEGAQCGERLYQAVPEPARYPLAVYISRFYKRFADVLIVDEGHEYGTDGSAQERACHRLTNLGWPTIMLTGSVMNGYAESLFANWWALFPKFRLEFDHNERGRFRDRYGYRKRLIQDTDKDSGKVVAFGSRTDRVERKERDLGNAPGLLPLFILQHLLPNCVTLQKADLKLDLPPCFEIPVRVPAAEVQLTRHMEMLSELFQQVRRDAFSPLAGKLWGQVAEAPSQLDRATQDVGNCPTGAYEVRYPESVGGDLVHSVEPEPADVILPKEQWALDTIAAELAEGRNVLLFQWHTELLPRMQRLLEARFGFKVPILDPEKVPTGKRKDWITKHVLNKGARILLANPVCVQTGLNNLVYFCTQVWMQNPACNPIVYRQATGRADRIGQTREVRIYFPMYDVVTQTKLHSLLFHKVGVSMATDGLDAESALQAAGVGETGRVTGLSVGKELYKLLEDTW
jgi:hypothetical protein